MADEIKKRAELLAMAKARGKTLKPEHEEELRRYEKMGVIAGPEGKERPVSDGAAKRYEDSIGIYAGLKGAVGGFQDEFAGNTLTGGAENSLQSLNSGIGTPGQRDWWSNFRSNDNLIRNDLFGAALTDTEKKAYEETTVSERMDPKIVRKNLARRAEIIRGALARRTNFMKKNGSDPEAIDALAGEFSADFSPEYKAPSADGLGTGESKDLQMGFDVETPTNWRATPEQQEEFSSFVGANRETLTPDLLVAWMKSKGLPTLVNADEYVAGLKADPNAPTQFNYDESDRRAREDAEKRVRDDLPLSNPVVAAAAGFGDVIPGRDKIIAGVKTLANDDTYDVNLANTRADAEVIAEDNPLSTLVGNVGGLVTGAKALTGAVPRAAEFLSGGSRAGQFAKGAAADTAYGGVRGYINADDDRALAGVKDAGAAAVGSIAGRGITQAAGRILSPVGDKAVDLLRSKGVPVTPGQALGPTAARVEEKLQSLPVVGDLIRNARGKAEQGFNTAVLNDALKPLGVQLPENVTGKEAMAFAQNAFNDAYTKARSGMKIVADEELANALSDLSSRAAGGEFSEETARRLASLYEAQVGRRLSKGVVSGDDYKKMHSVLGKQLDRARRTEDHDLADGISEMQAILDTAAAKSSPPEFVQAMQKADEGYAQFVRAENAAKMRGGDTGKFSASQFDSAVQRGDSSVRSKAYLRGDALGQDMAEAGKGILRDQVPNSGTFDRMAMGAAGLGALGGASYLDPTGSAPYVAGGLAALYLPGVRGAAAKAISGKRSDQFTKLGDLMINQSRIGSAFGVAGTLPGD